MKEMRASRISRRMTNLFLWRGGYIIENRII